MNLKLNTLQPKVKAKKRTRVGRGIGSGLGKTCGSGHKGQHARAGGYHKVGFEGGQMPHQRRVPKFGFNSHYKRITGEVRLQALNKINVEEITLQVLQQHKLLARHIKYAKIILSGTIDKPIVIKGVRVTAGARRAIEECGGKVIVG